MACILVYCESGRFTDSLKKIRRMTGVKRAFPALGKCDGVVLVEAEDIQELGRISLGINATPGVAATETLIGLEE
jgi:DNA-binding Lrp family transcriptional regulator